MMKAFTNSEIVQMNELDHGDFAEVADTGEVYYVFKEDNIYKAISLTNGEIIYDYLERLDLVRKLQDGDNLTIRRIDK